MHMHTLKAVPSYTRKADYLGEEGEGEGEGEEGEGEGRGSGKHMNNVCTLNHNV